MCATIISFKPGVHRDQAFADLQRVEDLLKRSGLNLDTEIGRTEDGDPWVTFCDPETNDVIVNVVLEDGAVVAQGPAFISRLKLQEIEAALRGLLRLMKIDPGVGDISRLLLPIFVALTALHLSDADASGDWPELGVMNILHTPAVSLITAAALIERVVEATTVALQDALGIEPDEQPASESAELQLSLGNLTEPELEQVFASGQDLIFVSPEDLLVEVEDDPEVPTAQIAPFREAELANTLIFSPIDPTPASADLSIRVEDSVLGASISLILDLEGAIILDASSHDEKMAIMRQFMAEATSTRLVDTGQQLIVYGEGIEETYLIPMQDGTQVVLVGLGPASPELAHTFFH